MQGQLLSQKSVKCKMLMVCSTTLEIAPVVFRSNQDRFCVTDRHIGEKCYLTVTIDA